MADNTQNLRWRSLPPDGNEVEHFLLNDINNRMVKMPNKPLKRCQPIHDAYATVREQPLSNSMSVSIYLIPDEDFVPYNGSERVTDTTSYLHSILESPHHMHIYSVTDAHVDRLSISRYIGGDYTTTTLNRQDEEITASLRQEVAGLLDKAGVLCVEDNASTEHIPSTLGFMTLVREQEFPPR